MEKNQFKPFDKVLVRDSSQGPWRANFYSHLNKRDDHMCIHGTWNYCIPYNEETKHLLGTTDDYQKQEPKEYHVWTSGTFNQWFTETQFKDFIKTAVIGNKDIKDFHVLYVKHHD